MKKIWINLIALLCVGNVVFSADNIEIYEPNSKNFRDGFEAGIKAIGFQAKTDGFQQKLIIINKPFLLVYDIGNTPLHEGLFIQTITAREGFETHFTKDFVSLGEFDREIDAKDAKDLLIRKYRFKANNIRILKNQSNIVTYPFLFENFYKKLLNEAESLGYIIKNEVIYGSKTSRSTNVQKTANKPKPKGKMIVFNNPRAMGYVLSGDEKSSTSFIERRLQKAKNYEFEKEIQTKESERFVKVKGENLYFSVSDVSIQ